MGSFKTIKDFTRAFAGALDKSIDRRTLQKMGNRIVKEIQNQSLKGFEISDGRKDRFRKLEKSTRDSKRRRGLSTVARNRDSDDMMNSLKAFPDVTAGDLDIRATGTDREGVDNFEKSKHAVDLGRPFIPNRLTPKLIKEMEEMVLDAVDRSLNKI